ncbi:hypothetical protein FQA39_LY01359 [Lamprigera yunnana]|nr:hypothetical protein FQA39_LY01359 [Lamprigera yunnana]
MDEEITVLYGITDEEAENSEVDGDSNAEDKLVETPLTATISLRVLHIINDPNTRTRSEGQITQTSTPLASDTGIRSVLSDQCWDLAIGSPITEEELIQNRKEGYIRPSPLEDCEERDEEYLERSDKYVNVALYKVRMSDLVKTLIGQYEYYLMNKIKPAPRHFNEPGLLTYYWAKTKSHETPPNMVPRYMDHVKVKTMKSGRTTLIHTYYPRASNRVECTTTNLNDTLSGQVDAIDGAVDAGHMGVGLGWAPIIKVVDKNDANMMTQDVVIDPEGSNMKSKIVNNSNIYIHASETICANNYKARFNNTNPSSTSIAIEHNKAQNTPITPPLAQVSRSATNHNAQLNDNTQTPTQIKATKPPSTIRRNQERAQKFREKNCKTIQPTVAVERYDKNTQTESKKSNKFTKLWQRLIKCNLNNVDRNHELDASKTDVTNSECYEEATTSFAHNCTYLQKLDTQQLEVTDEDKDIEMSFVFVYYDLLFMKVSSKKLK